MQKKHVISSVQKYAELGKQEAFVLFDLNRNILFIEFVNRTGKIERIKCSHKVKQALEKGVITLKSIMQLPVITFHENIKRVCLPLQYLAIPVEVPKIKGFSPEEFII